MFRRETILSALGLCLLAPLAEAEPAKGTLHCTASIVTSYDSLDDSWTARADEGPLEFFLTPAEGGAYDLSDPNDPGFTLPCLPMAETGSLTCGDPWIVHLVVNPDSLTFAAIDVENLTQGRAFGAVGTSVGFCKRSD